MKQAWIERTSTSETCIRFRLLDVTGKMLWQNRVSLSHEAEKGALTRLHAWVMKHGYTVVERQLAKGA